MRDLIVTENVSLDGVMAPMDGWFDPMAADDALLSTQVEHREAADALVLGRVTYEQFAGFWPEQTDDPTGTSAYLDQVAKYVLELIDSRTFSSGVVLMSYRSDEAS